jgi:hypothetical protein
MMGCEWETTRASPLALRGGRGEIRWARAAGMEVPLRPVWWRGGGSLARGPKWRYRPGAVDSAEASYRVLF